jgi:hypothetical protein
MPGVRGFGSTAVGEEIFYRKNASPKGYLLPFHADTSAALAVWMCRWCRYNCTNGTSTRPAGGNWPAPTG